MENSFSRLLNTELKTPDCWIRVSNEGNLITILFSKPRYEERKDGAYGSSINVPVPSSDVEQIFRKVVGIVKKSIRERKEGIETYSKIVEVLYREKLVGADIFQLLNREG